MDSNKAKEAVSKAAARKEMAAAMAMAALEAGGEPINPEIQAAQPALQPSDGYVTPYHRLGTVPPTGYFPGNMIASPNINGVINPVG